MAFQKEKSLPSGAVGNYWRVSHLHFERATMIVQITLNLYKDSTPGLAPLGKDYEFSFSITQADIAGNLVALAYTKMRAAIEELHTPIGGGKAVSKYPDLVGALDV
jgi:hypothetical protein